MGPPCTLLRRHTPPGEIEGILRPLMTRPEQPGEIANTVKTAMSNWAWAAWGENRLPHCARSFFKMAPASVRPKMEAIFALGKDINLRGWEAISTPR